MAIAKNKKRYQITLTPANVERFQRLASELGMPKTTMALILDDALIEVANTFQTYKDRGGKFGAGDLVKLMASKVAEAVEQEEGKNDEKKTCPDCGRPWHKFHDCQLNPVANPTKQKRNPNPRRKSV